MADEGLAQEGCKCLPALLNDERGEAPAKQPKALHPQDGGSAEIHGGDHPGRVEGEVAERREIVEVGVPLQSFLGLDPAPDEFCVLHFQFDPMDL